MGYRLYSAFEYEFYLVDPKMFDPLYEDNNFTSVVVENQTRSIGYDIMRNRSSLILDHYGCIGYDIMRNLRKIGIMPEVFEAEYGPCQHELTLVPEFGMKSIDNAFRYVRIFLTRSTELSILITHASKS